MLAGTVDLSCVVEQGAGERVESRTAVTGLDESLDLDQRLVAATIGGQHTGDLLLRGVQTRFDLEEQAVVPHGLRAGVASQLRVGEQVEQDHVSGGGPLERLGERVLQA